MTQSFAALGVSAELNSKLAEQGIEHPFPVQSMVVPSALAGNDVLAKSPTGSGKTLAFALPIIERLAADEARPAALVLVPTRELAVQVSEAFESLAPLRGLSVATVYGGVPLRQQGARAAKAHVLVATPGRLQDLVDRRLVSLADVRILVLDEADRMLDMGFKPQVDRILRLVPRERQTMFFSATLDGEVGELARSYTSHPARFEADLPEERRVGEVEHRFVSVTAESKIDTLVELLESEGGRTLVFVRTKRGADRLAGKLVRRNVAAVAMHGDLNQRASGAGAAPVRHRRRDDADRDGRRGARTRPRGCHACRSTSTRPRTARATSTASGAPAGPGGPVSASRSSCRSSRARSAGSRR